MTVFVNDLPFYTLHGTLSAGKSAHEKTALDFSWARFFVVWILTRSAFVVNPRWFSLRYMCSQPFFAYVERGFSAKSLKRAHVILCQRVTVVAGRLSSVLLKQSQRLEYTICASKNGVAALELQRTLGVMSKTAWFIAHRVRYVRD